MIDVKNAPQVREVEKSTDLEQPHYVKLYCVPAVTEDKCASLLQQRPEIGELLGHAYVSYPYVPVDGEFPEHTFWFEGGRTAAMPDKQYTLSLQELGMSDIPEQETFHADIKGVGSAGGLDAESLTRDRPDLSPEEIKSILDALEPQLLITWGSHLYDRPQGSQTSYLENHGAAMEFLIQKKLGIKFAPYVGTTRLPLGVMRKVVEVSRMLGVKRQIGMRYSYRAERTPADFGLVQEVRLMPSNIRGNAITNGSDTEKQAAVHGINLAPSETPLYIRRLMQDAARYLEIFPRTLRMENGDLVYAQISDLMTPDRTKSMITSSIEPSTLLLKDTVLARTGIYYVDWESINIEQPLNPNDVEQLCTAYTVGFMSELTRLITNFQIEVQRTNGNVSQTVSKEIEQQTFLAILAELDPQYVRASLNEDIVVFQFNLLGEWKTITLKSDDFVWQFQ